MALLTGLTVDGGWWMDGSVMQLPCVLQKYGLSDLSGSSIHHPPSTINEQQAW
jgi:hypothetical protein